MDFDPKKALRIDRAKKQQREIKKIDYREMNDFDLDDEFSQRNNKRRTNFNDI